MGLTRQFRAGFFFVLLVLGAFSLSERRAFAQAFGDGNGDGVVDGADLLLFEPCMTGPLGPVGASCVHFDAVPSNGIDLSDLLLIQRVIGGPCNRSDYYAGFSQLEPVARDVTGARAKIFRAEPSRLCNEVTSNQAACILYVGVADEPQGGVPKWAQIGRCRVRFGPFAIAQPPEPSGQIVQRTYTELFGGGPFVAGANYIRQWFPDVGGEWGFFNVAENVRTTGSWAYFLYDSNNNIIIPSVSLVLPANANTWASHDGDSASFHAEMFNLGDRVPGGPLDDTDYQECGIRRFTVSSNQWTQTNLQPTGPGLFHEKATTGIQYIDVDHFLLWDWRNFP